MSRLLRVRSAVAVVLTTAIALPTVTLAHDDEPGLSVEPATSWPGGTTTVRGDVPTTSAVTLDLVGPEGWRIALATVEDPQNGHFQRSVVIPKTASTGRWTIEATAGGVPLAQVAVAIGAAPAAGAQDERAEPVTAPAAIRPTVLPSPATSRPSGAPGRAVVSWTPWALGAGGAVAVLVWVRRRRTPHRAA